MAQGTELREEHRIIKITRQIARERIAPGALERDKDRTFPWDGIHILGETDLLGVGICEAYGGSGAGRTLFSSIVKEIGGACASTALVYVSHSIVAKAIEVSANEAIKEQWLPAMLKGQSLGAFAVHESDCGSNAGAITTGARKDGNQYILEGSKFFITSAGEANLYLVLARTDPEKGLQGMSTFLVPKDTPGLSFGPPEDKMGLTSISSREIFFSDCRVPVKSMIGGLSQGMEVIGRAVVGWGFFGAAAISAGIGRSAMDLSVEHAKERTVGGQPIGVHQAVQFLISDMILGSEAAELFLLTSATEADRSPGTAVLNAFKAKLFASEAAVDVTNKAIQVLGGHGYCRDYTVERLFRDARGLMLHFKTSEWLRQDIAKAALGL
jgi:butyryl-CoA dehydrogenase